MDQIFFKVFGDTAGTARDVVAFHFRRRKVEEGNVAEPSLEEVVFDKAFREECIAQAVGDVLGEFRAVVDFKGEAVVPRKEVLNVQAHALEGKVTEEILNGLEVGGMNAGGIGRVFGFTDEKERVRAVGLAIIAVPEKGAEGKDGVQIFFLQSLEHVRRMANGDAQGDGWLGLDVGPEPFL